MATLRVGPHFVSNKPCTCIKESYLDTQNTLQNMEFFDTIKHKPLLNSPYQHKHLYSLVNVKHTSLLIMLDYIIKKQCPTILPHIAFDGQPCVPVYKVLDTIHL